jgi:hypothetical protein
LFTKHVLKKTIFFIANIQKSCTFILYDNKRLKKMKRILHLTLFLGTFVLGCDKTIDVSQYDPHPLTLKVVELQGNTYKMSWNALPTSDFIDYQLIRSINDTVPDMLPNDTLIRTASLVTRINDKEQTTFFDSVTIAGGKVSFRLFARYRDHSVSSINVKLTGTADVTEIPNVGDQIFYSAQNNLFIFADKVNDLLATLNLNNNAFREASIPLDDGTIMGFNDGFGNGILYTGGNFGSMLGLDPVTLMRSMNFFTNSRNAPVSVGGGGNFAYCSVVESATTSSIQLFENVNFSSRLGGITLLNNIAWILVKPPTVDDLFAIESNTTNAQVMVFQNLAWNKVNNPVKYNTSRSSLVDASRFEFAPDGSFFVTGRQGNIYNRSIVLSKQLNSNANYNSFYIDGNLNIYAATNRRIDIYNAPNYNLTRSIACRVNPSKIFVIGSKVYLFAPSANKLGNTMLEKIVL